MIYETGLDRNAANHVPLTPLGLLERAAAVFPARQAYAHGPVRRSYAEFYARCRRLAAALSEAGIERGDTVSIMAPNVPAMLEAHYGVPMTGAVLNALNIRLDAATIAFTLEHAETKLLLTDREFSPVIEAALARVKHRPRVIDIDDPQFTGEGRSLGEIEFEEFMAAGDPEYRWTLPEDEWQAIALNYTSGTTGNPKGVVYHHRGAMLNAIGNALVWHLPQHPVYLWTLPMFHCNGWCFPWTLSLVAGKHVCLRRTAPEPIFEAMSREGVTHLCGAPIVVNMLAQATEEQRPAGSPAVEVMTAAAPPPASVIAAAERRGFHITHVYGLTETYGPAVICEWHDEWDTLPVETQAARKARQGVRYPLLEGLMVANPETMAPVAADGQTLGEVFTRGNITMKGYLKNPRATDEAFAGGWFHTGDLAVLHPDGYIELKDRSKDIIISGGENISTIEVEGVLYQHPAVLEAAVVARPCDVWGETPCAFVLLRPEATAVSEQDLIEHCRANMAHYKVPKTVVFGSLPKTSTGKVLKYELRERAARL